MTERPEWLTDFKDRLLALANPADPDRGKLAELRRCRGEDTGRALYRVGHLFRRVPDFALNDAIIVACLFAMHWDNSHRPGASLGKAMRLLTEATGSESIAKRFIALLDSEREDLSDRLRHVVALLKAKEVGLDWQELLWDLRHWASEKRWVQQQWARDFWRESREEETDDADSLAIVDPVSE